MNCKPGDLAVVISGKRSCGRIVRVIRLMRTGEFVMSECGHRLRVEVGDLNVWLIDGLVCRKTVDGVPRWAPCARDSELRPIRDPGDDVPDESTAWLPPVGWAVRGKVEA